MRRFPLMKAGYGVLVACGFASAQICPYGEPPADFCSSARVIPGDVGQHVVLMDVTNATAPGENLCGEAVGNTVWFQVTPSVSGQLTFSTCHPGTSYDTVVHAYTGSSCEFLSSVACNDDTGGVECANGCSGAGSTISFFGAAGTTYWFAVGSYHANSANCSNLCLGAILTVGQPCGDPPRNLACSIARELPGTAGVHEAEVDVTDAFVLAGEPLPTCGVNPGHTVWFHTVPAISGQLTFTTCHPTTTYDTIVQAYSGSCTDPLVAQGCNDDDSSDVGCFLSCPLGYRGSTVTIAANVGQDYYFQVASYDRNASGCDLCLGARLTVGECAINRECDDQNDCTIDTCASGTCVHSPTANETPCGDPTARTCDGPDFCLNGICDPNFHQAGSPCPNDGLECTADQCNGSGACVHPPNPDGSACTNDGNQCTFDQCLSGSCVHPGKQNGTTCGSPNDTACDNPDTCVNGQCTPNLEPAGTLCRAAAGPCDLAETCTGNSANCPSDGFLPASTVCRAATSVCDVTELCTGGLASCPTNQFTPSGTACPDDGDECTQDVCDGDGSCTHPSQPDGTSCADDGNQCTDDVCSGGFCAHPNKPNGTACGSGTDTACDDPDTCLDGTCQANFERSGTPCPDDGNPCTDDRCDGVGLCVHPNRASGTPCPNGLFCDGDESCDGLGACRPGTPPCMPGEVCMEDTDRCEADCNRNGVDDLADLESGTSLDCNRNVQPDECDIAAGAAPDWDSNHVPDACDLASGASLDQDANGVPDECDASPDPIVRITEVMPYPNPGDHEWVGLYSGDPASLAGWELTSRNDTIYMFPGALSEVPPGALVLVYFDGLGPGSDDYDFSDGLAVLHSLPGLTDVLGDTSGQVALTPENDRGPDAIHSFVAYGDPVAESPTPLPRPYIGSGAEEENARPVPGRSLGLDPGAIGLGPGIGGFVPSLWHVYERDDVTPGRPNVIPRSYWATVADRTVMGSDGIALGWLHLPGGSYQFQLDDDPAFGSPLLNLPLAEPRFESVGEVPEGSFFWRVRTLDSKGRASAWSPVRQLDVLMPPQAAGGGTQERVLGVTWLRQRKDTNLLCIDGDVEGNPAAPPPKETWDSEHPDAIYTHGDLNCVRASIAMIATLYGGNLSQDRISYEYLERNGNPIRNFNPAGVGNPHDDLGHHRSTIVCGSTGASGGVLFHWALGLNQGTIHYAYGKPSFAEVRGWIDAGRPISRFDNISHQTVIAGYRVLPDGTQQVRNLDPWTGPTWENYATLAIGCHYVPPAAAPSVRSDEAGIRTDSDGDGVMDWDELVRFHTSAFGTDTDADFVPDKLDIREYAFNNAGQYALRQADFDGDGKRKELDADNDDDGALDGCEDVNHNGRYEPALGETDNFNAASCGGTCQDGFEPNDTAAQAHTVSGGSFRSSIGPSDDDYYAFDATDFVDMTLRVTYEVRPQPGHGLRAEFDEWLPLTETTVGTLDVSRSNVPAGRHVFSVFGESTTTVNCYRAELSMVPSVIVPDAFDDQSPPGEPRNDTLADAAVIPDTFKDTPYPIASAVLDLNHDMPSDIDYFTIQLPPAMDPVTGRPECCPTPLDPSETQGHFRIILFADTNRPFNITVYNSNGTTFASTSGLSYGLDCPHDSFPEGRITFSLRDPAGRNIYQALVGYSRCYFQFYPDWFLEYDPPLLRWSIPEFPNDDWFVFPIDPEVQARYFEGTATEPFPPEFGFISESPTPLPMPPNYNLNIMLPLGGPLELALINEQGNVVAEAFDVGGLAAAGEVPPLPAMAKRLEAHDLPPGMYFLRVSGGAFGTPYILDADLDGDFDSDSVVDLRDVAAFQRCFDQAAELPTECTPGDLVGDGRVDLGDVPIFIRSITGPH